MTNFKHLKMVIYKRFHFILLILLWGFDLNAQAPQKINYQGMVRDLNGIPITTLNTIGLHFRISDNSNAVVHDEIQTAVAVNTLGLFNTQIGATSAISNTITWENGPYTLTVNINTGSGFNFLGAQELVSVPFALYAKSSGNGSLPSGTKNGQTLRWDGLTWNVDSNLTNDGSHVGIGLYPAGLRSRLHVTTNSLLDTTVVFAYHPNMVGKGAGFRSIIAGNTPTVIGSSFSSAIYGGNFTGINNGNGLSVGTHGMGIGNGLGVGLLGIGYGSSSTSTATGLYATAIGSPGTNKLAAVFDQGKVIFNDSLFIIGTNTVGASVGDVLTYMPNGQAKWQATGVVPAGLWVQKPGYLHLFNSSDRVGIGTGTVTPLSKTEITNEAGNAVDAVRINDNGTNVGLHVFKTSTTGQGVNIYMGNGNTGTGLSLSHLGSGTGIISSVGANTALQGQSSGTQATIFGGNGNAGPGIYGSSTSGFGVLGVVSSGTAAIAGINNFTLSDNSNAHGVYALTNNGDQFAAGLKGENKGQGAGVYGVNTNSVNGTTGVYGTVTNLTNSITAGVRGENNGMGAGVKGFNNGVGPAIKASSGIGITSALALWVENGHIKATGQNITTPSVNVQGGFVLTGNSCSNCNDVRGTLNINVGSSTMIAGANFIEIPIVFNKPYSSIPIINLTPSSDMQGLDLMVVSPGLTGFSIRVYRPTGGGFPVTVSPGTFNINYQIIE
ncbi:MAG: hypothetical protein IPM51_08510 [Sphingobacteriaceae bacterium]|nr:hypothetical protein [Sphingobacteriaceae bacterium]